MPLFSPDSTSPFSSGLLYLPAKPCMWMGGCSQSLTAPLFCFFQIIFPCSGVDPPRGLQSFRKNLLQLVSSFMRHSSFRVCPPAPSWSPPWNLCFSTWGISSPPHLLFPLMSVRPFLMLFFSLLAAMWDWSHLGSPCCASHLAGMQPCRPLPLHGHHDALTWCCRKAFPVSKASCFCYIFYFVFKGNQ